MLLESLITAFLKREFSKILQLDSFEQLAPPRASADKPYLVYIHVPFCEELCPYCSFHRIPFEREVAADYFRALRQELRMYADLGYDFAAAYIGGGTPTVLPEQVAELLADLRTLFRMREISLETNPNHLIDDTIGLLKESGVNRLSVGVQTFDDELLKQMERYRKYGSGEEMQARLQRYMGTFDTLNVDMIFNFPKQTVEKLDRDLAVIRKIRADQVTFYPLMVSDVTRRQLARIFGPISYRQEKLFYRRIRDALDKDYTAGTAWCFSQRKSMIDEYIIDYDEYVGVGSGSFGYVDGWALANTFSIPEYIQSVGQGRFPLTGGRKFSEAERIRYEFVMKLFGTSLDMRAAEAKFGNRFARTLLPEITLFRLLGALTSENQAIRLTPKGQYFWVVMMREFFTGVNNFRDTCRARIGGPP
ncbi:MAG: coproporphyrinogen III oxidase family protein [Deltaproteobacteria bacterium]|nr:coproporphyrinogen III oxidase family protein [Deltaproteobacteria bacterium]